MKRIFSLILYLLPGLAVSATGDAATYSLGLPQPIALPSFPDGVKVEDGTWYSSNCVYVGDGGWAFRTNAAHFASRQGLANPAVALSRAVFGASWEVSKPQYYLADRIQEPDEEGEIDWDKTYAEYRKRFADDAEQTCGFVFSNNPDSRGVYASRGGAYTFYWYFTGGAVKTNTYIIGSACKGRPKRIYWTDAPYNGEKVSLYGKFVRFFGSPSLVSNEYATVKTTLAGVETEQRQVVSGLYLDKTSMTLEARGTRTGQAVMVYYADANYNQVLHAQVIEVCGPDTIACEGEIGTPLQPTGRGYEISGLTAKVRAGLTDTTDGRGQYLYQHTAASSYHPHDGDVFPIRPTNGERWKAEICWMEEDAMHVKWPFEIDQYESDWPADAPCFVRGSVSGYPGRPISIPERYQATLMTYQEPNGHAGAVTAERTFSTDLVPSGAEEGWSLLKLTGDNNVWFLPIRSILRTNASYYTLNPIPLPVGQEASLDGVSRSALGSNICIAASSDAGVGYVYPPGSTNLNYDAKLYSLTNSASAVYPVSTNGNVEVWWNAAVTRDDMPKPLAVPTLPVIYRPYWPTTEQAPQIVLASQKGSAGESCYGHYGAATFDATNAALTLPPRTYFPNGSGTVMFWTRASAEPTTDTNVLSASSWLVNFTTRDSQSYGLRIGKDRKLELKENLLTSSAAALPADAWGNDWVHIALTFGEDGISHAFVNGRRIADRNGRIVTDEALSGYFGSVTIGAPTLPDTNAWLNAFSTAFTAESSAPVTYREVGRWIDVGASLGWGESVRLTNDVEMTGSTAIITKDCTLDLAGHTITVKRTPDNQFRVVELNSGVFTLEDSVGGGKIIGGTHVAQDAFNAGGGFLLMEKTGGFVMKGGMLVDFSSGGQTGSGTIAARGNTFFRMEGGSIRSCYGRYGWNYYFCGAVEVLSPSSFVMTGGTIVNCVSESNGGGVTCNGTFVMTGGQIVNCTARTGCGGGVSVGVGGRMYLLGGEITGNEAPCDTGGGIFCAGTLHMYGGSVFSNKAKTHPCIALSGAQATGMFWGGEVDVEPTPSAYSLNGAGKILSMDYEKQASGRYRFKFATDCEVAVGRQVAEVLVYDHSLTESEIAREMRKVHTGSESGVTGYWSFRPGEDLATTELSIGDEMRTFVDRGHEEDDEAEACAALNTILTTPGAPLVSSCVLPAGKAEVTIYRQNNKAKPAYNPNEEHAFAEAGSGGFVVWALRCDLGEEGAPQAVLAEYARDGRNALQLFHVVATNATWPALGATCEAGRALPGPLPLTTFYDPWLTNDTWTGSAVFRDRKKQLWCIDGGAKPFDVYMWYRQQETFDWPGRATPAVGESVPWLAALANRPATQPHPWRWTPHWPTNMPTMKIGQTLTVAENGLPEVWAAKSVAVLYPDPDAAKNVVMLSDPTVEQSVALKQSDFEATGLSVGGTGGLTLRGGIYRFTEASPFISSRLGYNALEQKLTLFGSRVVKNAGVTILYPNVLSKAERTATLNLVQAKAKGKDAWTAAVNSLATAPVQPNTPTPRDIGQNGSQIVTTYGAVDHYALTALGATNYVVLIENDAAAETMKGGAECPVKDGDPINMHVFKVVSEYHCGRVVTRQDENNLLSQQLSILYTDPIGGKADDFEFQWASHAPNSDGSVPEPSDTWTKRSLSKAIEGESAAGLTRFVSGQQGDTLDNMVNKYWSCRYRAVANSPARKVMGEKWSAWCTPPALAEGWIQRVLNNVTPFNQRMTDLLNNKAETAVSMIQQAGAPFTGDVALNQDNLANVGLIQLYETLLNKAESMSILLGQSGQGACQQLLLAAERLHDLYKVLGDEAYSDAKNPTVGFGSTVSFSGTTQQSVDFGAESSSLFCFDNQVKTLLDEEICLLRGRSGASAPTCRVGPYYNRLLWNFTKGITAGEVAYAVNYGVSGTETLALSEEQAARVYPQGHGDAYGHYLSALKGWYRLLRNPNFTWGAPVQGEMNLADAAVNVDYYEEAKFAEAAVALAKTAADVVDLTARQAWRESGKDETITGYLDTNTNNAFGYGEWASRGGYGALVNWAVGNSLLPIDSTLTNATVGLDYYYNDTGLKRIDRGNTDELAALCEQAAAIVRAVDRIDCGENPLGLSDHAIPFDISPEGVTDGSNTHYEQVRDRAKTALANARKVLDRAQTQSNRLKMIQETAESYANAISSDEEDIENQLVGYYGTPYTGDIGPGKTYAQGYEGPDTIHYFYMDLDQYGLKPSDLKVTAATQKVYSGADIAKRMDYASLASDIRKIEGGGNNQYSIPLNLTRLGLVAKPSSVTGYRVSPGSIQTKYADLLLQLAAVNAAKSSCDKAWEQFQFVHTKTGAQLGMESALFAAQEILNVAKVIYSIYNAKKDYAQSTTQIDKEVDNSVYDGYLKQFPNSTVAGLSFGGDMFAVVKAALSTTKLTITKSMATADEVKAGMFAAASEEFAKIQNAVDTAKLPLDYFKQYQGNLSELKSAALDLASACYNYKVEATKLNALSDAVAAEISTAEALLTKRQNLRKRQVDQLSQLRYNEMFFRRIRDKTLTCYQTLFDLAQKYVFMTAQVYGYETGLCDDNDENAAAFLAKIIATRSLGAFASDGEPMVADNGDIGLAGYLAQMDANWLVLKPRLGINNPQNYTTWFSLRQELFRIYGGAAGDGKWAEELGKYWVEDIRETDVYRRQCQAFQSQFGLKDKEPGLVIPFSTTIDFAKNLFGQDLAGNDHGYDSTWYSTRIAAAGVWFDGYNEKTANANAATQPQFTATPTVYLIPAGSDCLRTPGQEDGLYNSYTVVDQVIPTPYEIGSQELDDDTWYPSLTDAAWGEASPTVKIRRHPMFRAYFGSGGAQPSDDRLDATRLVGRSVWNDQWYLIIPAGALAADRDLALSVFINGLDTNGDGKRDLKPVSDIKIGFRTYSQSGN